MNPHPPSSPATIPGTASAPEDLLRLKCPKCGGGLNLRRKHLGKAGRCVHCATPVKAIEIDAVAQLVVAGTELAAAPPAAGAEPAAPPSPTLAQDLSSGAHPLASTKGEDRASEADPSIPSLSSHASLPTTAPEAAPSFSFGSPEPLAAEFDHPTGSTLSSSLASEALEPPTSFGGGLPLAEEAPLSSPAQSWAGSNDGAIPSVASPFSTGTAMGGGSFTHALFGTASAPDSGPVQPVSQFGGPSPEPSMPDSAGSLAGSGPIAMPLPTEKPAPSLFAGEIEPAAKSGENVILDGDGRPMKEMSEEEKELFAAGLHLLDSLETGKSGRARRWLKRLKRVAIFLLVLAGIAFAVPYAVPTEKREVWKEQVFEWLEPGMVIAEYLPFTMPWEEPSDEAKVPIHRRAFDGLEQLGDQMEAYLEQSAENLNVTLEEADSESPD